MLTGDNSILKKATEAHDETLESQDQEELQLAIMDIKVENFKDMNSSFLDYILECEEYLQTKLNCTDLQIDKESKKIIYKGRLYSLNDYGKLTQENRGIILNKNQLNLQIVGDTKYDKKLEITKINLIDDVNWQTSDESIAKVENGIITPISEGETIITAICADYTAKCRVTVEEFIDDSYVQYDIEYDDIYSGKRFTKNTGWRLITQEKNSDGTYNIEFISTGIPCELRYGWYEIGSAIWKATAEQRTQFMNKFYIKDYKCNAGLAAAGLYYNFDKIVFKKEISDSEYNIGGYNKILIKNHNKIMKEVNGDLTGEIFLIKKGATVRNVTWADIRGFDNIQGTESGGVTSYNSGDEYADKKIGLFKLNDYYLDNNKTKMYLLANLTQTQVFYHLPWFFSNGTLSSTNGGRRNGLRPVITMKNVNMTKNGCVWIIND